MKRGRAWGSLPSPANYPQGKIHVAILSINPLNNAVVRRYFIASDLVRQAVGIEAERMGENERVSNGAFQLQCWSRWRGIFLTMMVLPLGGQPFRNTFHLGSLKVRTRLHMGLSQSSYYGDRQHYHSWIHGTH